MNNQLSEKEGRRILEHSRFVLRNGFFPMGTGDFHRAESSSSSGEAFNGRGVFLERNASPNTPAQVTYNMPNTGNTGGIINSLVINSGTFYISAPLMVNKAAEEKPDHGDEEEEKVSLLAEQRDPAGVAPLAPPAVPAPRVDRAPLELEVDQESTGCNWRCTIL